MSLNRDFAARLAIGLGGGLLFICIFWGHKYGPFIVFPFFAIIAMWEFYGMVKRGGLKPFVFAGYGIALLIFAVAARPNGAISDLHAAIAGGFTLLAALKLAGAVASERYSRTITALLVTIFGSVYIAGALSFAIGLHRIYELRFSGIAPYDTLVILPFAGVWASDTGAYLAGRLVGRDRLSKISPNKTVEGLVGGVFSGFVAVFLFGRQLQLALPVVLCLGLALPFVGLAGDLFESGIKRTFKSKDSGTFFKAHGGVLDRFDSAFFAAPFTYAVIYYFYIFKGN